ncbi:MAG: hypothetical protein HYY67_01750 [Thaumarchaeota archaeon]|nr:hypothetical protein [Nitrososphaerota archaeon]MCS4537570.1 hypothetical protein [Nitrososphaerota archaeon]
MELLPELVPLASASSNFLLVILLWRVHRIEKRQARARETTAVIIRALFKHGVLNADDLGDNIQLIRDGGKGETDVLDAFLNGD